MRHLPSLLIQQWLNPAHACMHARMHHSTSVPDSGSPSLRRYFAPNIYPKFQFVCVPRFDLHVMSSVVLVLTVGTLSHPSHGAAPWLAGIAAACFAHACTLVGSTRPAFPKTSLSSRPHFFCNSCGKICKHSCGTFFLSRPDSITAPPPLPNFQASTRRKRVNRGLHPRAKIDRQKKNVPSGNCVYPILAPSSLSP